MVSARQIESPINILYVIKLWKFAFLPRLQWKIKIS